MEKYDRITDMDLMIQTLAIDADNNTIYDEEELGVGD